MDTLNTDISALWTTINGMIQGFFATLPNIAIAVVVFAIFWFIGRFVKFLLIKSTAKNPHANVGVVLGRLAQWAILLLGILVAIAVVAPSVKPANVLSVLGVGSVAIGFAFKDILQNFVAGILLLLREPFKIGDQVIFKDFEGTVEDIDTRSTRLRTYDGRRVIIPNGEIYTNSLLVNTAFGSRRSQYDVGIGYGDDIGRASEVMLETVRGVEGVLSDPAPDVVLVDLAGSSVNLRVRWWTAVPRTDVIHLKSAVLRAVAESLTKAGVDLPFPTRVVLFHDQTDDADGDRTKQREGWPAGKNPPPPRKIANALTEASAHAAQSGDATAKS